MSKLSNITKSDIYLSIVVTSRNDNHGGDLTKRTTAFVQNVYGQAKKFNLPVELIFVEWNPLKDKPLLKDILPLPQEDDLVSLRFIIVPNNIHDTYRHSKSIPLYQMIGKNVGIRRAKGKFILCTNIDILFSDLCFEFLAQRSLKENVYYRANRCDIPKEVLNIESLEEQLIFGEKNILKRMGKILHYEVLHLPPFFYKFPRITKILNMAVLRLWKITHRGQFPHFTVDFDACGDFTLMSRQDWKLIQGYPELDMYSIHIDSMGIWAANAVGLQQFILPYDAPIYHIDHEDGWESKDAVKTIKFLESKPCLDHTIVHRAGLQIVRQKTSWDINDENWGMKNEDLQEYIF